VDIKKVEKEGVLILDVEGDIDSLSSFDLSRVVRESLAVDKPRFVFNLKGVEYINSSGLGSMISFLKRAREKKGDVKLASVKSHVLDMLRQTQMDKLFEIYDTSEEALKKFTGK
jgi:anti-anti-sigma factor